MRTLLAVLAVGTCRTIAPLQTTPPTPPLEASQVQLEFTEPGEGSLRLVLPTLRADVASVTWELALDGKPFASGVETRPGRTAQGELELRARLAWKHLGWREGARFVDVRVRGEIMYRGLPDREAFAAHRELLSQGAPVLEVVRD